MVKHTQTIRWQQPTNYLSVLDHFVELVLKRVNRIFVKSRKQVLVRGVICFYEVKLQEKPQIQTLSFVVRSNLFKKRSKLKLTEKRNVLETTVFLE